MMESGKMRALLLRAVALARRHRSLAESTRREYRPASSTRSTLSWRSL